MGEALRRLVGKCLCAVTKEKVSEYFAPLQMGVACPSGAEKIIHGLRHCVEEHWMDEDFAVMKIDMRNAFNLVSRQALLDECSAHFPELLPWASWCYGLHPTLWHPMGIISSETGVQQGDPLGPMFFCLVLHKLVTAITTDNECSSLLFHRWYIDDGVVAGPKHAVAKVFSIIQELGPPLGLFINAGKCELFGLGDLSSFSSLMKKSSVPNFEILGAPIGDIIFCAKFFAHKRADASKLLKNSWRMWVLVIPRWLCSCLGNVVASASWCTLLDLPPALIGDALHFYDDDVRRCFSECTAIDPPIVAWQQAQLSLSRGGLGDRSLSEHSSAAYISSLSASGVCSSSCKHL